MIQAIKTMYSQYDKKINYLTMKLGIEILFN